MSEDLNSSKENTDNSLAISTLEEASAAGKANSSVPIRQTIREGISYVHLSFYLLVLLALIALVTNTHEEEFEQMITKAMHNIMAGKSVIYTKTDLTQICCKANIRVKAVDRLVSANLLQHGENFWVEPSRSRKETKKPAKRILREGWLK